MHIENESTKLKKKAINTILKIDKREPTTKSKPRIVQKEIFKSNPKDMKVKFTERNPQGIILIKNEPNIALHCVIKTLELKAQTKKKEALKRRENHNSLCT